MKSKYYPPKFREEQFHCPYCQVFAAQAWSNVYGTVNHSNKVLNELLISVCNHCSKISYWFNSELIIPGSSIAPLPHPDLPETIKEDFLEARAIVNKSPRGAAALLRLVVQKLMVELGEPGKNINHDIASLVQKGLPIEVQQALDILRVIGNESVHPGELDIRDDQDVAVRLFELINFVVEDQITRKTKIRALYSILPEKKREEIQKRDAPKS